MLPAAARNLVVLIAVVALASGATFVAFFSAGGWPGTVNDVGNGILALLCAALAVSLHGVGHRLSLVATIGALIVLVGTALLITHTTGEYLAGLVSACGFGLIGLWLLMTGRGRAVPRPQLAIAAGLIMAVGVANVAGVVQGLEKQADAPAWLIGAGICWAGTYVLLPVWAISALASRR